MTATKKRVIPPSNGSGFGDQASAVPLGSAPDFELPGLPRDLTLLDDSELMNLFGDYVAWQNFASSKLTEAEIAEHRADGVVRYVEAAAMIGGWGSKDKVTVARAELTVSEEVVKAREAALQAYATRKTCAVVAANCERVVNLISRELTRRTAQLPSERRNNRWNP